MGARSSKTSLILMELILVVLFFSLSATIYARIFAGAYRISEEAADRTQAALLAQKVAENFYASGAENPLLDPCLAEGSRSSKKNSLYYDYDEQGQLASEGVGIYRVTLTVRRQGAFLIGEVEVWKNRRKAARGKSLEKLGLRKYLP